MVHNNLSPSYCLYMCLALESSLDFLVDSISHCLDRDRLKHSSWSRRSMCRAHDWRLRSRRGDNKFDYQH